MPPVEQATGWADPPAPNDAYFPDGRVAADAVALSPITEANGRHGPPSIIDPWSAGLDPMPDDPPAYSREQGIGRSPGQRWPHQPLAQQHDWDSPTVIDLDGHPLGEGTRLERAEWALAGPQGGFQIYYGQDPQMHVWLPDPIAIPIAESESWTAISMHSPDSPGGPVSG